MVRMLALAALLAASTFAHGSIFADISGGSVDGGWPSALSGQSIWVSVRIVNTTSFSYEYATWSVDPGSWPTDERGGNVTGNVGDVIDVTSIAADFDIQELTGSDGKRYAVYSDDDVIETHTIAAGEGYVTVPIDITLQVKKEDPSGTDPTPQDGDTNADGDVDWFDLQTLLNAFGTTSGASWSDGDFDGDGDVDFSDYLALQDNYVAW